MLRAASAAPLECLRYRVDTARAIRMAAREATQHEPAPAHCAVQLDGLLRILRAGWPIAARSTDPWRKHEAVRANEREQQALRDFSRVHLDVSAASFSCSRRKTESASARNARLSCPRGVVSRGGSGAFRRSTMSRSVAATAVRRGALWRAASRRMRLMSTRSTDRRAKRLPTVRPKRTRRAAGAAAVSVDAADLAINTNQRWERRIESDPACATAANSASDCSRCAREKAYPAVCLPSLRSRGACVPWRGARSARRGRRVISFGLESRACACA